MKYVVLMPEYHLEKDSKWSRRDSKKITKKRFTPDNRRSVRWLLKKSGEEAKRIQKAREQKEKETWQQS